MTVNLEEVACIVLAVMLLVGNVIVIGLTGLVSTEEQGIPRWFLQIAGTTILSLAGMVAVYKIPNSWWFHIVYESEEEVEDSEGEPQVACLQ